MKDLRQKKESFGGILSISSEVDMMTLNLCLLKNFDALPSGQSLDLESGDLLSNPWWYKGHL